MSDKPDVVYVKGKSPTHHKSAQMFLSEVVRLVSEGYVLHPDPTRRELPNFRGFPTCTMVLPEYLERVSNDEAHAASKEAEEKAREEEAANILSALEEAKAKEAAAESARVIAYENEKKAEQLAKDEATAEVKRLEGLLASRKALTEEEEVMFEATHKKADLLALAEKFYVDIPSDLTNPKAIKKLIRDTLNELKEG